MLQFLAATRKTNTSYPKTCIIGTCLGMEDGKKERNISDIDSNNEKKLLGFVLLKRMSNAARQCFARVPKRFYRWN